MRFLFILSLLPALGSAPDAREIVRQALEADQRNNDLALNYTYLQRVDTRQMDGSGKLKERKLQTWDVTRVEGSPYRRLVARNDAPLSPEEQKAEEAKLRQSIEERKNETPEERQKRVADYEERRRKQREAALEIPEAFDFRIAGEERVAGVDAWIIDATPRRGYRAKTSMGRAILPNVKGRLWIAKESKNWMKIEAEATDTISLGWMVVRVAKGSRASLEQTRVNDEVWLPKKISIQVAARVMLVKGLKVESENDYSNYRKFQAESKITGVSEIGDRE